MVKRNIDKTKKLREPQFMASVGKKGVGKTFQTLKLIKVVNKGNPASGANPERVLIFDVNNEYTEFKPLPCTPNAILKFGSPEYPREIRRITPFKADGGQMSLDEMAQVLKMILENYYDGLLVVEDISLYVSDSIPGDIIGRLCTNRHKGVDILSNMQMIGKIGHPKIIGTINVLRFHKTIDTVERHKNKFNDHYEILKIAEQIIAEKYLKGDIRFFCYVNFDEQKIYGAFSKGDFLQACHEYIAEKPNETINIYLKKRNNDGKAIHTYATALKEITDKFLKEYYGNPK